MTHYTVNYKDQPRKRVKALIDTRAYLGRERFDKVRTMLRESQPSATLEWWHQALSFAGVQGYPVRALYESYSPHCSYKVKG